MGVKSRVAGVVENRAREEGNRDLTKVGYRRTKNETGEKREAGEKLSPRGGSRNDSTETEVGLRPNKIRQWSTKGDVRHRRKERKIA